MSESSYSVVLAVFQQEAAALTAYKDLQKADRERKIDLENVVLIHKEESGKIELKEAAEKISGEAGLGALVGGALGLLAGPVGLITLGTLGAALGGITAKLDDVGFDDTRLKMLGEALEPGKSAVLAVLDNPSSEKLVRELQNRDAEVVVEELPIDFKDILEGGGSFAYRIAEDEVQEAAVELGLIKPDQEDYVSEANQSDEHDSMTGDSDSQS